MKRRRLTLRVGVVTLVGVMSLALISIVVAQVSSNYDLSWHVIGGGGGRMESSGYTVHSTLGQPVTGSSTGSGHTLCAGYWCDVGSRISQVYVPLVLMSSP
jgi:hypothetical protein